jgi:diphthamide biosynthesis protein 7
VDPRRLNSIRLSLICQNLALSISEEPFPMDDAKLISSKVSLILDLPPSCIQFCPAHPGLFVVGTYNLEKNEEDIQENKQDSDDDEVVTTTKTPQSRNGSLLVYRVDGTEL